MRLLRSEYSHLILCLVLLPVISAAQFTTPLIYGDAGNENGHHLISDQQGGFFLAGTTDASFAPIADPLAEYGEEDFFLGRVDALGDWQWAKSGGSFLNDEIRVMRRMPDGDVLVAGTFWLEFNYDDLSLHTTDNIKGIFLLRIDDAGSWKWGKVINGADQREVNDLKIASDGQIYLTGYFSETLQFETLELEAKGKNDGFLLQLDPDGRLVSWQQLGYKGTTRGQTIALHPEGGYYWGGIYDDTLRIDTAELYANTFDRDVYVSRFDATGQPLWARRAGGVFEEELIAMAVTSNGDLLASGFLIGVMTLSEDISVQSRNGNPDIFMFRYAQDGEARWARTIGGELIDLPTDLCLRGTELMISGTYQQQIGWDALSTPFSNGVNGFVASFDAANGNSNWLAPVTTNDFAFMEALELDKENKLFAVGSFSGTAQLGSSELSSPGQYDFFLTEVDPTLTAVYSPETFSGLQLFPNPAQDLIFLETDLEQAVSLQVFDTQGRMRGEHRAHRPGQPLQVEMLEPGTYWLVISLKEKFTTKAFTIVR